MPAPAENLSFENLRPFTNQTFTLLDMDMIEVIPRCARNANGYPEDYLTFVGANKESRGSLIIRHVNVTETKRLIRALCKLYQSPKKLINMYLGADSDVHEFHDLALGEGMILLTGLMNLRDVLFEARVSGRAQSESVTITGEQIEIEIHRAAAANKKLKAKIEERQNLVRGLDTSSDALGGFRRALEAKIRSGASQNKRKHDPITLRKKLAEKEKPTTKAEGYSSGPQSDHL